jgi:hypothetical protein
VGLEYGGRRSDLFGAPGAQFKHALEALAGLLALGGLVVSASRLVGAAKE